MPERRATGVTRLIGIGHVVATLATGVLLLTGSAGAQAPNPCDVFVNNLPIGQTVRPEDQATNPGQRWGFSTLAKLCHLLPDASGSGLSPDPADAAKTFANETTANNIGSKYPAVLTAKIWWFNDAELDRQFDQLRQDKDALKRESESSFKEFDSVHGVEMKAMEKAHAAEIDALTKQAEELFRQGKYQEGKAIMDKVTPFHYAPFDALTASLDKKDKEFDDRARSLSARRRKVTFAIWTNRMPSITAPFIGAKPIGTLAGRTLYRNDRGTVAVADQVLHVLVDLEVFVGPPGFQNPKVNLGDREMKVKGITVWAAIESRPETLQADEATVKQVLEGIDYDGLARLIDR